MPTLQPIGRGFSAVLHATTFLAVVSMSLPNLCLGDEGPPALPLTLKVTRYLTARDTTQRLQVVPPSGPTVAQLPSALASVCVMPTVKYQQIQGFGGAFTDAAAQTLLKLPAAKQEQLLHAYFDPVNGLGYTLCRTHINSCDFSTENYAYDEKDGDVDLKEFSIDRDKKALIPMIKRAQAISNNGFKLFASPWSPPWWMKTNGEMNHGGKLKPEYRDAWANYYVRYIKEYDKLGIPIWAVTVQNEPAAKQPWASCLYSAEEERDFVRDHLGPTFAKAGLDTHIIIWDHNRDIMYERIKGVMDDPEAAKYVWGLGFHWYVADLFDNVQRAHDTWPDKHLILTEACQEGGPHTGEWAPAERYARSEMQDLNHWAEGWVDWNLALDEQGGPNNVGNYAASPVIVDTKTGDIKYQASFYYLGHFSKFVRPGAYRVLSAPTSDSLETAAFVNPDGSTVVVIMNRTEIPVRFDLKLGKEAAQMDAPQHSIQTIVIKPS